MKTILYYFSATGNSLSTARLLAKELGSCEVVGMPSLRHREEIHVQANAVGFVFPIYYSDMPHLMRKVISQMQFEGTPYIFSVCTCRGHYGDIAQRLDTLLREQGQKLSFIRHVPMPGNSRLSTPEENAAVLAVQRERVCAIAEEIRTYPTESYTVESALEPSPVHHASNMRGLTADESCIGCGICEKICPMENIRLKESRAVIGDSCISCLTCFHWCPQEAIWMSKAPEVMMRRFKYHHPDITLADILNQKT